MTAQAHVAVEPVDHAAICVAVSGEIDLSNVAAIEGQIFEAITNHLTAVTVDLGGLTYLDSAGLRVLFALGARLDTLQIDLELIVPPDSPIRRMIELSGVATVIPVNSNAVALAMDPFPHAAASAAALLGGLQQVLAGLVAAGLAASALDPGVAMGVGMLAASATGLALVLFLVSHARPVPAEN